MDKASIAIIAAIAAIAAILALPSGPSEHEAAQATADNIKAAQVAAQRFERDLRACKLALGPTADLIEISGTDHYVCREMPIEPTPAELLHKYAQLGGKK